MNPGEDRATPGEDEARPGERKVVTVRWTDGGHESVSRARTF